MNNIIKITLISIGCPLWTSALAITCTINDTKCSQLQAMEKAGIKQTMVTKAMPATEPVAKKPSEPEPYKIPAPQSSKPQKNETSSKNPYSSDRKPKTRKITPINIYAPTTNQPTKPAPKFKFTPPKQPLQSIIKKPVGIKY